MMTDRKYTGGDVTIASGTDPWLQVAGTDIPVDLMQFDHADFPEGIFAPVNTNEGIERDDELDIFEGDLQAARALGDHLTGLTGNVYEVWYEEEEND